MSPDAFDRLARSLGVEPLLDDTGRPFHFAAPTPAPVRVDRGPSFFDRADAAADRVRPRVDGSVEGDDLPLIAAIVVAFLSVFGFGLWFTVSRPGLDTGVTAPTINWAAVTGVVLSPWFLVPVVAVPVLFGGRWLARRVVAHWRAVWASNPGVAAVVLLVVVISVAVAVLLLLSAGLPGPGPVLHSEIYRPVLHSEVYRAEVFTSPEGVAARAAGWWASVPVPRVNVEKVSAGAALVLFLFARRFTN